MSKGRASGKTALQARPLGGGTSQAGVRLYNERLLLSLIRRHASLPMAEIARQTGLSAQTVSVIVRQLESDGLLLRNKPRRGKVGQPLIPFSLNPDGAFAIGLKIGRRSADLMLLDLAGNVRNTLRQPYSFPTPSDLLSFVGSEIATLLDGLKAKQRERIAGLGVAAPFELWKWQEETGASPAILQAWRKFDIAGELSKAVRWPVHFCNDATAACAAELLFGRGIEYRDFAFFYVGYFIGGGIVIDGGLYQGRGGNAGALGSFPVAAGMARSEQLIRSASLYVLERELRRKGRNSDFLWRNAEDWSEAGNELAAWIERAARSLADAAAGVASVLECSAIVIDGAMPSHVRRRLTEATRAALAHVNLEGISEFVIVEGTIGADARAMGAASLPLIANFIIDRDVLFKEPS